MTIENIINNTKCPYAKYTNLPNAIVIKSLEISKELSLHKDYIGDFFKNSKISNYDALCIVFLDENFGNSINNLAKNTHEFFKSLNMLFETFYLPKTISINEYNRVCWPSINGERFFMVAFASCYPITSSRYNYGDKATFFFLQPVSSFVRKAKDGIAISDETRDSIKNLFVKNNQPYNSLISSLKNEWVKMVHPLNYEDQPIKWWEY